MQCLGKDSESWTAGIVGIFDVLFIISNVISNKMTLQEKYNTIQQTLCTYEQTRVFLKVVF